MPDLRIVEVQPFDLDRYLNLLEDVAEWLKAKGIAELHPGTYRSSREYFAESIERGEIYWARLGEEFVGAVRLLLRDPIVWPEITKPDALYVYNLVVNRAWSGRRLGREILKRVETRTRLARKDFVRLDCFADSGFLRSYYKGAGFKGRGEVNAEYPHPIGTLKLQRFEKWVPAKP